MEMAVYSIIKARETADALRKELSDLQAELAEKIKIKKIEGDALTVIQMRYWDGYGISKIAANVLGQKTEKERNRIKYILRKTENQLNN